MPSPSPPPAPPGQESSARRLAPSQLSSALVQAELERLAASAAFSRSPRHLRFLRHLADAVLRGDTGRLREMALGVDVFYRSESRFDPRQDSIVRVEARRLRQKLARYYAQEGHDVRLVFVLPVGSYVLEIRHRLAVPPSERHRVSVGIYALSAEGQAPGMAALGTGLVQPNWWVH
jgi:hypothetical protein